jgi:hypothetical protein
MGVIIALLNKTLLVALILATLTIVRHLFMFARVITSNEPKKYKLTPRELIFFGLAISYAITCIINGIKL